MMKRVLLSVVIFLTLVSTAYALPDGAAVVTNASETKTADAPSSVVADGGNITLVNISVESQTNVWQGFIGEVSGNITLEDSSGDKLFQWTVVNIGGEVFAARNSTIPWASVTGVNTTCVVDNTLTGVGTDSVNNTFFSNTSLVGWQVGEIPITSACQVFTFVNSAANNATWEEIILNASGNIIYATKIRANGTGYDNSSTANLTTHDYQMIVPETNLTTTTTYFFYAELT